MTSLSLDWMGFATLSSPEGDSEKPDDGLPDELPDEDETD